MAYCSGMRLFYWLVLAFLTLCAFAAPGQEWIGWALIISLLAVLMMVDAMFFSSPADFAFDPNVRASLCLHPPHPRVRKRSHPAAALSAQPSCPCCTRSRPCLFPRPTRAPPPPPPFAHSRRRTQLKNYARNQQRFES